MRHKTTQTLFSYFNRVRNGNPAPLRADINPSELKTILPDMLILEMDRNGIVVFRLAGMRACSILGRELRGEDFNLLWCGTDRHKMKLATEAVLANQMPLVVRLRSIAEEEADCDLEMLLMPLYSRPGICDRLFGSLSELSAPAFRREQFRLLKVDALNFVSPDQAQGDQTQGIPADPALHGPLIVATSQASTLRTRITQLKLLQGGRRD